MTLRELCNRLNAIRSEEPELDTTEVMLSITPGTELRAGHVIFVDNKVVIIP